MKKISLILSLFIAISFCTSASVANERQKRIDSQMQKLFQIHLESISKIMDDSNSQFNEFDKVFFKDFSFLNTGNTQNFFQTIQHDLERGKSYAGLMQVSYSSYSIINGKTTGVNYEYRSDGKNIILTKGTLNNGNVLRAVYNYNLDGKLLNTTEIKNNQPINKNTYRLEI